ncbi:OLC1v1027660C1 [Oldenlandia corymbosa var. corymbosa]|uniref:OLC1v1027660C1 n=1 Tax=Oldenlandia corymbosa var. corymbosa TaxID=529605 RepID=A0AAV1CA91_OLDCO|nr:OLC1v1027660C1 [Oldenlandia corymbosa var. corymbosa]
MADGEDDGSTLLPRLIICLVAAASAAVVVTIYHCVTTGHIRAILRLRTGGHTWQLRAHHHQQQLVDPVQNSMSMENSLAELIPSHKYQKGSGLILMHLLDSNAAETPSPHSRPSHQQRDSQFPTAQIV